jgi:hypothetical protein
MAKSLFDNILSGIGGAVQGATNFLGQATQGFSPAVQRFQQQAAPFVSQQPIQQGANVANDLVHIGQGIASQGAQYFNPENVGTYNNPVQNFWSQTQAAQDLGKAQQFTQNVMPKLRVNWAQPAQQNVQQALGGNNPIAQGAGFVAGFGAGIPESILNVPSDIARSGTNIGTDIRNGQFTGTRALGDVAEAALPIATIWTMGEGGTLLKSLANDSWKKTVIKGFMNGTAYGAGFGGLAGLGANKDTNDFGQQFEKTVPYVLQGMLSGGMLGSVLGPAGKFFFGGKTGNAATLSQHGLVPPQAKTDAARILDVPENAPFEEIQNAYMKAANQHHPTFGGTDEAMSVLNNAYEMLTQNHAPLVVHQNGQMSLQWSPEFGGNLSQKQMADARRAIAQTDAFYQKLHNINSGEQSAEQLPKFSLEKPNPEDQALGMAQLRTPQETPSAQLSDTELAQQQLRANNPQLQYPDMESQQLQNLVRVRDGLHARITSEAPQSREAQNLVKMREGLQQEMEQAQSILGNKNLYDKRYPNMANKTDIRAHIRELKSSIKQIDTQVKDIQVKLKSTNEEKNTRIKTQLNDLEQQINTEKTRLGVKQTVEQAPKILAEQPIEPVAAQPQPQTRLPLKKRAAGQPTAELGKSGNHPTFTGSLLADYDPAGKLDGVYRSIAEHLIETTPEDYGTGRQIPKMIEGRQMLASKDATAIQKAISGELGSPESEKRVLYALDGSISESQLTPGEKAVFDKVRILTNLTYDVAKRANPDLQPIQNYAPLFATSIDKSSPYAKFKSPKLSTSGPQMVHREIRAFEPAEGGQPMLGRAEDLGLKPSGKSGEAFEDANGNQFVVRDATKAEKEGLGIRYEDNVSNAIGLHLQSVLRGKENFGVRNALKGKNYAALRVNPGEGVPKGYERIDVPGLDRYAFDKDVVKGLKQLSTDWKHDDGTLWGSLADNYADLERFATRTGLLSPLAHGPNVAAQTLLAVGKKNPITGIIGLFKNIPSAIRIIKEQGTEWRDYKQMGSNIGEEGERPSLYSNKAPTGEPKSIFQTIKGGFGKFQESITKPTWQFDALMKMSAYKALEEQGVPRQEAINFADRIIGDYGNINPGLERTLVKYGVTFYPWLKTEVGSLGAMTKNPAMLGSLALIMGVQHAVNQAWQNYTGNPDAKFRVLGGAPQLLTDVVEQMNPQQLKLDTEQGKLPPVIYSHLLKPLSREAIQQGTNHDFLRGKALVKADQTPEEQTSARLAHLGNINPNVNAAMAVDQGKKSLGEFGQSFLGVSTTPHLPGFQAAPNLPLMNTEGAKPGTGMGIIHTQDEVTKSLTEQQRSNMQAIKDAEAKGDFKTANQLYVSDPKLFEAKATLEKAQAAASGRVADPLYRASPQESTDYLKYENMSSDQKAAYALKNPAVIEMERQRDAYRQSDSYKAQQHELTGAIKDYKAKTPVHNPLYDSFDNQQIATFQYWKSLSGQQKTDWAANHPWVFDENKLESPYYRQITQQNWQNRPANQSLDAFKAEHPNSNIQGVDADGNLAFKADYTESPFYTQLSSQQRSAAALYTAYNGHNMVAEKRALLAQNPWLPAYWEAQSAWIQANPFEDGEEAGGLGIQFGNGKGGSSGGSNYDAQYMAKQFLYGAMDLKPGNVQLKMPQGQRTKLRSADINQSLYSGKSRIPAAPTSTAKKLPKLSLPDMPNGQLKFGGGKNARIQL